MGLIPEWYDENISIAALWGPCVIPAVEAFDGLYTEENWDWMIENDIWVMAGPEWDEQKPIIEADAPPYVKDSASYAESLPNNPIDAIAAYAQCAEAQRFQRYYPGDWFEYKKTHGTYPKTELLDFGLV